MVAIKSLPHLFAAAEGKTCEGPHKCFFCGTPCGDENPVRDYLRDTFTDLPMVACPGSDWVCNGCVLCFMESGDGLYPDGSKASMTKAFRRMHTWLASKNGVVAMSKKHIDVMRATCIAPPPAPWGMSIAVSGQKQILYRGRVNHINDPPHVVTLEGEAIRYEPTALRDRLRLCGHICSASGKPALVEPPSLRLAMAVMQRFTNGESLMQEWSEVWRDQLSRLAAFLCENKEASESEYPATRV